MVKSVLDRGNGTKPRDVIMGMVGFAYIHESEDEREVTGWSPNVLWCCL